MKANITIRAGWLDDVQKAASSEEIQTLLDEVAEAVSKVCPESVYFRLTLSPTLGPAEYLNERSRAVTNAPDLLVGLTTGATIEEVSPKRFQ
jgi:hypothetical protein